MRLGANRHLGLLKRFNDFHGILLTAAIAQRISGLAASALSVPIPALRPDLMSVPTCVHFIPFRWD